MALTAAQRQVAQLIMGQGRRQGLSPARQRELVAISMAESGLNPRSVNKSSGAGGLFQLLSSGYVNRAKQLGGVFNPTANINAILPDYVRYWRQHPNAAAGEAGRDVERSGMGADFYARPLSGLGDIGAGAGPASSPLAAGPSASPGPDAAASPNIGQLVRKGFIAAMIQGKQPDFLQLVRNARRNASATGGSTPVSKTAPADTGPVNDPKTGNWVDPATGKVIGTPYHGTHTLGNWESDRALDVAMKVGTPIYAPFAGSIGSQFGALTSDPNSRFGGLRLHVVGPTNEWYGAHLSRFAPGIKPGVRVTPGQLLGYSGSASGVAHLHEGLKYGDPYRLIR